MVRRLGRNSNSRRARRLFVKSKFPSFSANSGDGRIKKIRNPKEFLTFPPCILPLFANNPATHLFPNKP
ncbi:hypothetical protein ANACOL_00350 [Anaerotruncus colihominis DSM 17241]|uniref:Uncharacterized protein n=1 Tax=Anaerotruncus colihominis DSM 17241 TaxID=445972 RepID=B0P6H3_9FIRM|nr:hypothetical protein ANACOL_00350 [Anaerotruncus colihominis DSM 17241]